jgi:hypothetical protein
VLMTGDAWTDTYSEVVEDAPSEAGYALATAFFLVYMLMNFFVTVNLFIMVVCEAFEVLSESNRRTVEKLLPDFKRAWADYDPRASGILQNSTALEEFVSRVPGPVGTAMADGTPSRSKVAAARLQSKVDFLRAKTGFGYGFQEVLLGLVALWLTEEEQVKVPGIEEQIDHLAASITIAARMRALAKRMQAKKEVQRKRAEFLLQEENKEKASTTGSSINGTKSVATEAASMPVLVGQHTSGAPEMAKAGSGERVGPASDELPAAALPPPEFGGAPRLAHLALTPSRLPPIGAPTGLTHAKSPVLGKVPLSPPPVSDWAL